jgi:hypothetical protein
MLLSRCLHQSCHAIYIHTIKLRLRNTPHCTRTVYYGINIIYQAAQAVKIPKVTLYPLGGSSGVTCTERCGTNQRSNLPANSFQSPR